MRIEIRNPANKCEHCEAGELVATKGNHTLEVDLCALFERKHSRWHPLKRRRFQHFRSEVDVVCAELRELTSKV